MEEQLNMEKVIAERKKAEAESGASQALAVEAGPSGA